MSQPTIHNLDEDVRESFRFSIKGHEYDFRQMTSEEMDMFQNLKNDKEIREYLCSFVTKVKEDSPDFVEMTKKMIAPHWTNFSKMVVSEMTGKPNGNG